MFISKLLLWACLFLFSSLALAASPQEIYSRLVKANGFWTYPKLVVSESNEVQAYNFGTTIQINRGLINSVRNDDELAFILGHELAHGKLWHTKSSHKAEFAADKLGAILANRAGYNSCRGTKWLLLLNDENSPSHPAPSVRYNRLKCH